MSEKQPTHRNEDENAKRTPAATVTKHISRRVHPTELHKLGIDPNGWLDS